MAVWAGGTSSLGVSFQARTNSRALPCVPSISDGGRTLEFSRAYPRCFPPQISGQVGRSGSVWINPCSLGSIQHLDRSTPLDRSVWTWPNRIAELRRLLALLPRGVCVLPVRRLSPSMGASPSTTGSWSLATLLLSFVVSPSAIAGDCTQLKTRLKGF
jgi:hypothetical protein